MHKGPAKGGLSAQIAKSGVAKPNLGALFCASSLARQCIYDRFQEMYHRKSKCATKAARRKNLAKPLRRLQLFRRFYLGKQKKDHHCAWIESAEC